MKNVFVLGLGEIGKPLCNILTKTLRFYVYGFDLDREKCLGIPDERDINGKVFALHVCIPFKDQESYIQVVKKYYQLLQPELVIIHSTVIPTTTNEVYKALGKKTLVANSPIFGVHATMEQDMNAYPHLIGGTTEKAIVKTAQYFKDIGFCYEIMPSPVESELMKIMETTYAGWMITFFNEFHRIADSYQADFPSVVQALTIAPNKPIWYPDVIGGHCIMQNINLLMKDRKVWNKTFLQNIIISNNLREEERKNIYTADDIRKIKKIRESVIDEN
jgi:UDP-N-acetyl-D-mannosaminuronate dehydrogenase